MKPAAAERLSAEAQRGLVVTTAYLYGATIATAVLGFAYWWLAARLVQPAALGEAAAAISIVSFVGPVAMWGIGSLALAELSRRDVDVPSVLSTLLVLAVGVSLLLSLVTAALLLALPTTATPGSAAVFGLLTVCTVLTSVALVLDQAAIALGRGPVQLWRNALAALAKLLALPACLAVGLDAPTAVLLSWTGGLVLSFVAVPLLPRGGATRRPAVRDMRRFLPSVWAHNMLSIVLSGPRMALPMIASMVLAPAANAAFYAAFMLSSLLFVISSHLSMSLAAIPDGQRQVLRARLRAVTRWTVVLGLPCSVALAVAAVPLLHLLGPHYTAAGAPLALLALGFVPNAFRAYYAASMRVIGQLPKATRLLAVASALELVAFVAGTVTAGPRAGCALLLLVTVAEGLVLARLLRSLLNGTTGSGEVPARPPAAPEFAHPRSES